MKTSSFLLYTVLLALGVLAHGCTAHAQSIIELHWNEPANIFTLGGTDHTIEGQSLTVTNPPKWLGNPSAGASTTDISIATATNLCGNPFMLRMRCNSTNGSGPFSEWVLINTVTNVLVIPPLVLPPPPSAITYKLK